MRLLKCFPSTQETRLPFLHSYNYQKSVLNLDLPKQNMLLIAEFQSITKNLSCIYLFVYVNTCIKLVRLESD